VNRKISEYLVVNVILAAATAAVVVVLHVPYKILIHEHEDEKKSD